MQKFCVLTVSGSGWLSIVVTWAFCSDRRFSLRSPFFFHLVNYFNVIHCELPHHLTVRDVVCRRSFSHIVFCFSNVFIIGSRSNSVAMLFVFFCFQTGVCAFTGGDPEICEWLWFSPDFYFLNSPFLFPSSWVVLSLISALKSRMTRFFLLICRWHRGQ